MLLLLLFSFCVYTMCCPFRLALLSVDFFFFFVAFSALSAIMP